MTKKLIVDITDELDEQFRNALFNAKGFKKGVIKEAVEEAIVEWIRTNKK